jgi:type III secretory pathway lipoprotein EscJ
VFGFARTRITGQVSIDGIHTERAAVVLSRSASMPRSWKAIRIKRNTFGTGKFDRKRLIMVMELRVQVWNLQDVWTSKVAKAIDSDKFDVYAFHQSTT